MVQPIWEDGGSSEEDAEFSGEVSEKGWGRLGEAAGGGGGEELPWRACLLAPLLSTLSDSLRPYGPQLSRLLCPWDSPGKREHIKCQIGFHPRGDGA